MLCRKYPFFGAAALLTVIAIKVHNKIKDDLPNLDESYDAQIENLLQIKKHKRKVFVGDIKTINAQLEELRKNKLIEELAGITDGNRTNTLP